MNALWVQKCFLPYSKPGIPRLFLLGSLSKLLFHVSCIKFTEKCNQTSRTLIWNFPYRQAVQGREQGRRAGAGHTGVAGRQGRRGGRQTHSLCVWERYAFPTPRPPLWRHDWLTREVLCAGVRSGAPLFCARSATYHHCPSLQPKALLSF